MNDIKPIIFLLPLITLIITGVFYFSFLKKTADKRVFKKYILRVIIISFILNLAWELIQMPLYKNAIYNFDHIAFCALATVADVLMVLLLYFVFVLILKNTLWVQHIKLKSKLAVIIIGGIGAVLSEMRHLSLGSWAYNDSMPIIPFVNVGITPVLQFMILPLLIYFLSLEMIRTKISST